MDSLLNGTYPSALRTTEVFCQKVPLGQVGCRLNGKGDRACRSFSASRRDVSSRTLTSLGDELRTGKDFLTGSDVSE